jgi:quinoprotein glucose dehydrogenase
MPKLIQKTFFGVNQYNVSKLKARYNIANAYLILCMVAGVVGLFISCNGKKTYNDWTVYGGSKERIQYSALDQIDTNNVKNIQVAWVYHTKDADSSSQIEANSVIVDDVLYGISPQLKLFAVDAATGKEKWVFDPAKNMNNNNEAQVDYEINACRGVAVYKGIHHAHLIFYTVGSFLYSISSIDGKPVTSFGNNGKVDLHEGFDVKRDVKDLRITSTTPGVIYNDLLIMGSLLDEEEEAAPGDIRAYNVHTGKIQWTFHTIPHPGEEGYETWEDPEAYKYVGGANDWGGFSLDETRGLVFAATGSSNPDFYGGKRQGNNLFANSILALDAATGKRIWHFQTIHHDLWDWDLPTAPILASIKKDGNGRDVVIQVTKQGFIFMLDRVTGRPIYPVEEKRVPIYSDLNGEWLSPTQPFPTFFEPFVRLEFKETDLNNNLPDSSYQDIKRRFTKYKSGKMFTPPSKEGTIVMGLNGGAEWGGPSLDPVTGTLYINANEMPWIITMKEAKDDEVVVKQTNLQVGKILYNNNCKACHGKSLSGSGNYPSLIGLERKYNEAEFKAIISSGRRMMPAFKKLSENEKASLASYILNMKIKQKELFIATSKKIDPFYKISYKPSGYQQFLSKEGYPAISPPWGTLSAIDLNTGKLIWKNTFGDYPEFEAEGIHTGSANYGGPVVTAGGLLFIAATRDSKFRAFNKRTGELLFETKLPSAGFATPSVYSVNGKQYIVIACGGGKMKSKSGDTYVAFTLGIK